MFTSPSKLPNSFTSFTLLDTLRDFVRDTACTFISSKTGVPESYAYCLLLSYNLSGCFLSLLSVFRMFYVLRTFFFRTDFVEVLEDYQHFTFNFLVLVDASVVTPGLLSWFSSTYSRVQCLVAVNGTSVTPFSLIYQHRAGFFYCHTNRILWALVRARPHGLLLILPNHPQAGYIYGCVRTWFLTNSYITFCPGFNPTTMLHRVFAYPLPGFSRASFLYLLFFLRECVTHYILK